MKVALERQVLHRRDRDIDSIPLNRRLARYLGAEPRFRCGFGHLQNGLCGARVPRPICLRSGFIESPDGSDPAACQQGQGKGFGAA